MNKIKKILIDNAILIGITVLLLTILAYTTNSFSFFEKKYESYIANKDAKYTGIWTSASKKCINCKFDIDAELPLILKLNVSKGIITGTLDGNALSTDYEEDKDKKYKSTLRTIGGILYVEGKLTTSGGDIHIWGFKDGVQQTYGNARIYKKDKNFFIKMLGEHYLRISDKAEIIKTRDSDGNICKKSQKNAPWLCAE